MSETSKISNVTEKELSAREERALDLLLLGHTTTEVADSLHCQRMNIWRWMKKPYFKKELQRRRLERRNSLNRKLDYIALKAIKGLQDIAEDKKAPYGVRVKAWTDLLDRAGVRPIELVQVVEEHTNDHRVQESVRIRSARATGSQAEITSALLVEAREAAAILETLQARDQVNVRNIPRVIDVNSEENEE